MTESLYKPGRLAQLLNVTPQTLKQWEEEGKIKATKTKGGHRRYLYTTLPQTHTTDASSKKNFIYARVSSKKQSVHLEQQIQSMQSKYPNYTVIQDIGSGLRFDRRGLVSLLDEVVSGNVESIVIYHKDRLCLVGFEIFEYIMSRFNVKLIVFSEKDYSEKSVDIAKDVMYILQKLSNKTLLQKNQKTKIKVKSPQKRVKLVIQSQLSRKPSNLSLESSR